MSILNSSLTSGRAFAAAILLVVLLSAIVPIHTVSAATTATLTPNGQGFYTAWSGDNTDVDETSSQDCGSSDSVITGTANARESFTLNLSSIPNGATITSVSITTWDRGDSASGGTYKTFTRLNGTDLDAAANLTTSTASSGTCTQRGP